MPGDILIIKSNKSQKLTDFIDIYRDRLVSNSFYLISGGPSFSLPDNMSTEFDLGYANLAFIGFYI